MKKIILIALLVLGVGNCFAQKKAYFGIKTGFGASHILNSLDYKSGMAAKVGGVFEYNLSNVVSVGLAPSFNYYSNKFSGYDVDFLGNNRERLNVNKFSSIETPIYLKIKTKKGNIKPYYSFGFGPSFLLSHKNIEKGLQLNPPTIYGIDVSKGYDSVYSSIYNSFGFEFKGDKIFPFVEFSAMHSVSPVNKMGQYENLNIYTVNVGFKF